MTFTSTDSRTLRMIDITGFSPGILSPSTAFSAMSSTFMAEASASAYVELQEVSAAGTSGTDERGRK